MATAAVPQQRLGAERRFFLGMAAALLVCTVAGFAQTYYLMRYTGAPSLTPLVHLHGALFTVWVLLFGLQAGLISVRRTDVHVMTGTVGIALAIAILVVGTLVAINSSRPPRAVPLTREQFLIFPLMSIGLFALFIGGAFANRNRPDHHKRFMLLATINLVVPAFSRMTAFLPFLPRGVMGAMVIANIFLAALALYDWRSRGRLHPATIWGGAVMLVSEPLRFLIARSGWWEEIARSLMS